MKTLSFLVLLTACATSPHNYADTYVAAVMPEAHRHVLDDSAVLVRHDLQLFVCIASADHHTSCYAMIDWTPKPAPASASLAGPQPAAAASTNPVAAPTPPPTPPVKKE